jgi:C_GCAxxG_C_C family probable redox protein
MSKKDDAMTLFKSGANCSQAVLGAFAEECGLTQSEAMKLASGFGAGMGRMREVCGAVSAMVLVANLKYGSDDLQDKKAKDDHYEFIQKLANEFKKENGSIVCRELLNLAKNENTSPISEARTDSYYKKRPCVELVGMAAEILENNLRK